MTNSLPLSKSMQVSYIPVEHRLDYLIRHSCVQSVAISGRGNFSLRLTNGEKCSMDAKNDAVWFAAMESSYLRLSDLNPRTISTRTHGNYLLVSFFF